MQWANEIYTGGNVDPGGEPTKVKCNYIYPKCNNICKISTH